MTREEMVRLVAAGFMRLTGEHEACYVAPWPLTDRHGRVVAGGDCRPGANRIRLLEEKNDGDHRVDRPQGP